MSTETQTANAGPSIDDVESTTKPSNGNRQIVKKDKNILPSRRVKL